MSPLLTPKAIERVKDKLISELEEKIKDDRNYYDED
jgi:hypothetical protein